MKIIIKFFLLLIAFLCVIKANAQNYLISFAGTGSSTTVTTVKIENITKGTSLTLSGNDVLCLTSVTGVPAVESRKPSEIMIYPNPMTDNSTLVIYPPCAGDVTISVFDATGKIVKQDNFFLENSIQEFHLSGFNNGLYLINVRGNTFQYSAKLLCNGKANGTIHIEKKSYYLSSDEKTSQKDVKGTYATVNMDFSSGNKLKFTGVYGNSSTIIIDYPTQNKTITFDFTACTDGDNNNYPVVTIGTQVWMADNLRTTKYKDGTTLIPNVTSTWANITTPAYCWYNNNETANKAVYGALYNWYTVNTGNLCPAGWHVPTDQEWTTLIMNMGGTSDWHVPNGAGGNLKESGTIHWAGPNTGATDQVGFTALPAGYNPANGTFYGIGNFGYWWTATEFSATMACGHVLRYDTASKFYPGDHVPKEVGFSVRCIKD